LVAGHILEIVIPATERYPDIYVLWNLTICWGCFCIYWVWLVAGLWKMKTVFSKGKEADEKKKL